MKLKKRNAKSLVVHSYHGRVYVTDTSDGATFAFPAEVSIYDILKEVTE